MAELKIYICRCAPYDYFSAYSDIALARDWWGRHFSTAGTRQVRQIRWSMTSPVSLFPDETEQKEKENKILTFQPKLIQGGGEGDAPWLDKKEVGDTFYVRPFRDTTNFTVQLFMLLRRDGPVTILQPPHSGQTLDVDPVRFSKTFQCFHNGPNIDIKLIAEKQEETEMPHADAATDGQGDRPQPLE